MEWLVQGEEKTEIIRSPFLFSLYAEVVMRKIEIEESEIGYRLEEGTSIFDMLMITYLSQTTDGLQHLVKRIK